MKRLCFIIIIIAICFTINVDVIAKVKFGSWDKWNEELPSWDHKGWGSDYTRLAFIGYPYIRRTFIWLSIPEGKDQLIVVSGKGSPDNAFFLKTHLSFIKNQRSKASVTLFSPAVAGKNVKGIECNKTVLDSAEFAIAVFPKDKKEVIIRTYENENGVFRFSEEWTVAFENNTEIIPEDVKFSQKLEEFVSQSLQSNKQNIIVSSFSLVLLVREKFNEITLGFSLKVFDGKKTIRPIFF